MYIIFVEIKCHLGTGYLHKSLLVITILGWNLELYEFIFAR